MADLWTRLPRRQRWRALWLTTLALIVAGLHTASDFPQYRYKSPGPAPASDGVVTVPLDRGAFGPLRPPVALILRVSANAEGQAVPVAVELDGQPVCSAALPASGSRRIDCTITSVSEAPVHTLQVRASGRAPWVLEYLELATHFGNVTSPNVLFIAPRQAARVGAGPVFIGLIGLLTFASTLLPEPRRRAAVAYALRALAAVATLLVAATVIVPLGSQFEIVISQGTLARWLIVAQLSPLLAATRRLFAPAVSASWLGRAARAAVIASLVLLAFWSVPRWQLPRMYANNYSGFLKIQESFFDGNPLAAPVPGLKQTLRVGEDGYDGEMMWALAFDPLATRFADRPAEYRGVVGINPGYRMGRIGYSALTAVAAHGDPFRFPKTMMWLLGGALFLAAAALSLLAQRAGKSAAYGLAILLIPGFWVSIQTGLPEPLAAAALLWGVLLIETGWWVPGALCLGYSLLVRETGAIAVLWIAFYAWRTHSSAAAVKVAALGLLPVAAWRLYLAWRLWPAFGMAGLVFKSPSDLPLRGIVQVWQVVQAGNYWPHVWQLGFAARAFSVLLVLVALASLLWIGRGALAIGTVACAYALNAVMLDFPAVWAHVWNTERTTFELFVVTALVCATTPLDRWRQRAAVALAVLCAAHLTISALDAALIRETIVDLLIAS